MVTAVIFLLAIFVLIEVITRRLKWRSSFRNLYEESNYKKLSFQFKRNYSLFFRNLRGEKILYKTNRFGQRNSNFPLKKPNREKRILVIGDSLTFGFGLKLDKTYPVFLQRLINKRKHSRIRVINAAVGTYNVVQNEFYLKKIGMKFKPKIVVLGLNLANLLESNDHFFDKRLGIIKLKHPNKAKFKSNTKGPFGGRMPMIGRILEFFYLYRYYLKPALNYLLARQQIKNLGNLDHMRKVIKAYLANGEWDSRRQYLNGINNFCQKN